MFCIYEVKLNLVTHENGSGQWHDEWITSMCLDGFSCCPPLCVCIASLDWDSSVFLKMHRYLDLACLSKISTFYLFTSSSLNWRSGILKIPSIFQPGGFPQALSRCPPWALPGRGGCSTEQSFCIEKITTLEAFQTNPVHQDKKFLSDNLA